MTEPRELVPGLTWVPGRDRLGCLRCPRRAATYKRAQDIAIHAKRTHGIGWRDLVYVEEREG